MKKLLSILAALGLTATGATSVVACGSSKNDNGGDKPKPDDKAPKFTSADINGDVITVNGKHLTEIQDFDKNKLTISPDCKQKIVSVDREESKITIKLSGEIAKLQQSQTYTVAYTGTNLSATFVVSGTGPAPTPDDNKIVWADNATENVKDDNTVVFTASTVGNNVNIMSDPTITINGKEYSTVADNVKWTSANKSLLITFKEGMAKDKYTFNLSFKEISGSGSISSSVTAVKDTAAKSEIAIDMDMSKQVLSDKTNTASWKINKVGVDIDLSSIDVKVNNYHGAVKDPIKSASVGTDSMLVVTFNDGLEKQPYNLSVTFNLKNGFSNAPIISLEADKNSATDTERTLVWSSDSVTANDSNKLIYTLDKTKSGKEVDLTKQPIVTSKDGISFKSNYDYNSNTLTLALDEGTPKKDGYKFDVKFTLLNGFTGDSISKELTGNKVNYTKDEVQLVPVNASPTPNGSGDIVWNFSKIGADIDSTDGPIEIVKADWTDASGISQLTSWANNTIEFVTGSTAIPAGEHTITLKLKLKNGFASQTINVDLKFTVPATK